MALMNRNHRFAVELCETHGNGAMRNTVESVAANLFFGEIFGRHGVGERVTRQRLVKRRVECGDVDGVRQLMARGAIGREAVWVVQRGESAEFVDCAFNAGVDDYGGGKSAAMDDAMAHTGDGFSAERGRQIGKGCFESVRHAGDAFNQAFAEEPIGIGSNCLGRGLVERVFQGKNCLR